MDAQGKEPGRSEISRVSDGCAIREQWTSASGVTGMSIDYYDREDHKWHQDWVGGGASTLHFIGDFTGKSVFLGGKSKRGNQTQLCRNCWAAVSR